MPDTVRLSNGKRVVLGTEASVLFGRPGSGTIRFRVVIEGVRESFGHVRYDIRPVAGTGSTRVEAIILDAEPEGGE
jgi:hypothetical protein